MKTRSCIAFLFVTLTGVLQPGVLPASRADMTTTAETRTFLSNDNVEVGSKILYARGRDERIENHSKFGDFPTDETIISLCEKNQQITLDEKFLIYHVRPFMWGENDSADEKAKSDAIAAQEFPADKIGSIVNIFQITPIGEEVIAGIKSKGYLITGRTEKTGCAQTPNEDEKEYKSEAWFGDKNKVLNCFESEIGDAFKAKELDEKRFEIVDGCKISYESKGDSTIFVQNFGKLLMRTKLYKGGKVFYSEEITKISEDALDDALFTVPLYAKKVDEAEYNNARQQALEQAILAAKDVKTKAAAEAANN